MQSGASVLRCRPSCSAWVDGGIAWACEPSRAWWAFFLAFPPGGCREPAEGGLSGALRAWGAGGDHPRCTCTCLDTWAPRQPGQCPRNRCTGHWDVWRPGARDG